MKTKKPKAPKAPPPAVRGLTLVEHLDLDPRQIEPSPFQPRDEFPSDDLAALSESLKVQGQIHALAVRKASGQNGCYELLDGERRWRAGTLAGLKTLRAEVFDCTDQQARQIVLASAIHRQDLNPIEEARAYEAAIEAGDASGPTELAEQLGLSQGHVSNRIRLLDLPYWWQQKVISREIGERHARAVLPYHDALDVLDALMNDLAAAIVRDELPSVAAWEKRVEVIVERVTKRMAGEEKKRDREEQEDWQEDDGADEDVRDTDDHAGDLGEEDEAAGMDDQEVTVIDPVTGHPGISAIIGNPPYDPAIRAAEEFARDLYAWRCDWQRWLIAREIGVASEESMLRIAILAATCWDGNGETGRTLAQAVDAVKMRGKDLTVVKKLLTMPLIDMERVAGTTLASLFWLSERDVPSPRVPCEDVEAVFEMLGLDMQNEWHDGCDQAGPLTERFWDLFDNEQLRKLHKKHKLGLAVSEWNRSEIIAALVDRRNSKDPKAAAIPFPKEIAKAKPVH